MNRLKAGLLLICALAPSTSAAAGPDARVAGQAAKVTTTPPAGLSLTWVDCPGGAGAAHDLAYACNSDADNLTLVCSAVMNSSVPNVVGAEVVVDVQSAESALPDWWQFLGAGTGGCRAGVLNVDVDFTPNPGCTDAWGTFGFGGIQGFTVGPPDHPFMNQCRIKAVAAVTSDHAVTLGTGVQYGLLKLVISSAGTTGATACAGCATAACLVFNSAILLVIPPASDVFLSTPAAGASNWATWQGTAADCAAVPTRRSSWGSLKSLYR